MSTCPGFTVHGNDAGGYPITKFCQHDPCEPGSEYLFAIRIALMKKQITPLMVENACYTVPLGSSICPGWRLRTTDGPYVQAGIHYDPTSKRPYTTECKHRRNECQIGVYWKYALYHLIARNELKVMILHIILNDGWTTRVQQATGRGLNPNTLIASANRPLNIFLWDPKKVDGWHDLNKTIQRKVLKRPIILQHVDEEVVVNPIKFYTYNSVMHMQRGGGGGGGGQFNVFHKDVSNIIVELCKFVGDNDCQEVKFALRECLDMFK